MKLMVLALNNMKQRCYNPLQFILPVIFPPFDCKVSPFFCAHPPVFFFHYLDELDPSLPPKQSFAKKKKKIKK